MKSTTIQDRILETIPLAKAMQLTVKELSRTTIKLTAPLDANSNDKGTAFGGSIYSLLVLSGWSLVSAGLESAGILAEVVIAKSDISFLKPVTGELQAIAQEFNDGGLKAAVEKTAERGYAKLKVQAELVCHGEIAATFQGTYCIKNKKTPPVLA